MMNLHWFDLVGFAGVALVLGAYLLLQTGRMRGDAIAYSLVNMVAAAAILIPVWYAKEMNWSVLVIEAAWIVISLYGIWHAIRRGLRKAPSPNATP